jgi:hypothetical protein
MLVFSSVEITKSPFAQGRALQIDRIQIEDSAGLFLESQWAVIESIAGKGRPHGRDAAQVGALRRS